MKLIALTLLLLSVVTLNAQDERPKLAMPQAAQIAQGALESLRLGPEYYLRSILFVPLSAGNPVSRYEARFEPAAVDAAIMSAEPGLRKYRVIIVAMDGTSSVIEREWKPIRSRSIIRSERSEPVKVE